MKTILFAFLLFASGAQAAPYLVSDPYPVSVAQPTSCRVAYDGSVTFTAWPAVTNADSSVICKIDIAGLPAGAHTAAVKACINTTDCSVTSSANFVVLVPGIPTAPANLRVVP